MFANNFFISVYSWFGVSVHAHACIWICYISVCFLICTEGSCWLLMTYLTNFQHGAVIQNGGREHGNVGGALQQHKTGRVHAQLEVLPIWVHWRVLHCTLPITKTNDMHVGKIATSRKITLLQHEMTKWW